MLVTVKFVKKAFYKNNALVVYLFVLKRLAGKYTKIYNACRTIVRLVKPLVLRFALVVVCVRSLLWWSIKSHDVDLSVFCLLLCL